MPVRTLSALCLSQLMLWVLAHAAISAARACTVPNLEPVIIAACAPDPVLADGRRIKVAGLAASQPLPCDQGGAMLSVLSAKPDRWGRLEGFFLPEGQTDGATNVTLRLLRAGYGLARPGVWPAGCWPLALAAEAEARQAKRGLWAGPETPLASAQSIAALRAGEGRMLVVEGVVVSVRRGRQRLFLNFGALGDDRFSVTMQLPVAALFEAQGLALSGLRGERVAVRGVVGPGPSMELNMVEALAVLDRR